MNTFNTCKVQIGLLYEPKQNMLDEHDELVQRALLANGQRRRSFKPFALGILAALFLSLLSIIIIGVFK